MTSVMLFLLSLFPSELLETLHDDVAIERIQFHEKCSPAGPFGGNQG